MECVGTRALLGHEGMARWLGGALLSQTALIKWILRVRFTCQGLRQFWSYLPA